MIVNPNSSVGLRGHSLIHLLDIKESHYKHARFLCHTSLFQQDRTCVEASALTKAQQGLTKCDK